MEEMNMSNALDDGNEGHITIGHEHGVYGVI